MPKSPYAIDQRHLTGPFDIIGDVHACLDELVALLAELGYREDEGVWRSMTAARRRSSAISSIGAPRTRARSNWR